MKLNKQNTSNRIESLIINTFEKISNKNPTKLVGFLFMK
jgi:hypothetical protein